MFLLKHSHIIEGRRPPTHIFRRHGSNNRTDRLSDWTAPRSVYCFRTSCHSPTERLYWWRRKLENFAFKIVGTDILDIFLKHLEKSWEMKKGRAGCWWRVAQVGRFLRIRPRCCGCADAAAAVGRCPQHARPRCLARGGGLSPGVWGKSCRCWSCR